MYNSVCSEEYLRVETYLKRGLDHCGSEKQFDDMTTLRSTDISKDHGTQHMSMYARVDFGGLDGIKRQTSQLRTDPWLKYVCDGKYAS